MSEQAAPLVLLCAGGTGGHMFPARALAEELLARGYRVALACDVRGRKYFDGMESKVDIHVLSSGTYRPGLIGKVRFLFPLLAGYVQSLMLVKKLKPAIAVGFGGYPSAPPLWAAQHSHVRTVLHEQNAILGLANILLIGQARTLALSWQNTSGIKTKYQKKATLTGNPVRAEIARLASEPYPMLGTTINLMIVGGSQGAAVFSDVVPKALAALPSELRHRLHIIQQARPDKIEDVKQFYAQAGLKAEVETFLDMPTRLRNCHLLITRSGASTVAELATAGRPAIYVPYPWNRDNQQTFNAQAAVDVGGGWIIHEKNMSVDALAAMLAPILNDANGLARAGQAVKSIGSPDAAKTLADVVAGQI